MTDQAQILPTSPPEVPVSIPGLSAQELSLTRGPIVILGPNGSGKTQFAKALVQANQATVIGAQRRTWLDEQLPVLERTNLNAQIQSQQGQWHSRSWHPTEELNFVLSQLIQEHISRLSTANEKARKGLETLLTVTDTKLIALQDLWERVYPLHNIDFSNFFPKVNRCSIDGNVVANYAPREMSDGERTILYMAARIIGADRYVIVVDEPELHMHSRLAVSFWNEAERLRPDCRFVYVTHDLGFALSRRAANYFLCKSPQTVQPLAVSEVPGVVATEVLGAATLPFHAKRVCMYEGEPGKGFATEFFSVWFDQTDTVSIPCGDRNSVCAAVSGLQKVGVTGAEVVGVVDRDYYSDDAIAAMPAGVVVLRVHEIESVLCAKNVVLALAKHLGKPDPELKWAEFKAAIAAHFSGSNRSKIVAERVRARTRDLLNGLFNATQVVDTVAKTATNHIDAVTAINLRDKLAEMFAEENARVTKAIQEDEDEMLAVLPGKVLLSLLLRVFGVSRDGVTTLVLTALSGPAQSSPAIRDLGASLELALSAYLPKRAIKSRPV